MTTPLTEAREAEIRAREQAATPGPWKDEIDCFSEEEGRLWTVFDAPGPADMLAKILPDSPDNLTQVQRDGAFIAHARQDVPDLLTALDSERAKVAEMVKELEEIHSASADGWTRRKCTAALSRARQA